jgi:hypothetical protein
MDNSESDQERYNELAYYTLAHPDPAFIHQHIVDAYGAQHAHASSKPIGVAFALAGLYLALERRYSGRQVQHAHTLLARNKKHLPVFTLPTQRGALTVADVLRASPGPERDAAIRIWMASVWQAWSASHKKVADWLQGELEL